MPVVQVEHLTHAYGRGEGRRVALDDVTLSVEAGEIFGFLGPNGSGKTTLFRVLSTLLPSPRGAVRILGHDASTECDAVRRQIGVVFQSPSLDKQLTARENLLHQGHLYGLQGAELRARIDEMLASFALADRAGDRVAGFSGGMRRRVEIAKGLLHHPRVLLMDEPSTGLDPAARIDLWRIIRRVVESDGVTVLVTTHLMDEADRCSRLAIMDRGRVLACDTPAALKARIGGDVISITTREPEAVRSALRERFGIEADAVDGELRFQRERGHEFVPQLIETLSTSSGLPGLVEAVSVGKPTLEDVFIRMTGHRLMEQSAPAGATESRRAPAGAGGEHGAQRD